MNCRWNGTIFYYGLSCTNSLLHFGREMALPHLLPQKAGVQTSTLSITRYNKICDNAASWLEVDSFLAINFIYFVQ